MKKYTISTVVGALILFSGVFANKVAIAGSPYNLTIPVQGLKFKPYMAQPVLHTRPTVKHKVGHTKAKKKTTHKKATRTHSSKRRVILKPSKQRSVRSGVLVHRRAPAIPTAQHGSLVIKRLHNRFGTGSHVLAPALRGRPGITGNGSFAPLGATPQAPWSVRSGVQVHRRAPAISTARHSSFGIKRLHNRFGIGSHVLAPALRGRLNITGNGSFAPLGATPQASSLVNRARQEVGGEKHSPGRVGISPRSGGGASGHATESGVPEAGVTTSPGGSTVHIDYGNGTGSVIHTDRRGHTTTESVTSFIDGSGQRTDFGSDGSITTTDPTGTSSHTTHPDGAVSETFGGNTTTRHPDGTVEESWVGGSRIERPDGTVTETNGGVTTTRHPDGTVEESWDGGSRIERPDGTVTETDGDTTHHFDGSVTRTTGDHSTTEFIDGTVISDEPNHSIVDSPDGTVTEKDDFGTTIRHPDGSVTRIYEGGSTTEYLNGTVIEKDESSGTVKKFTSDGSSTYSDGGDGSSPSGKHSSSSSSSGGKHTSSSSSSGGKHTSSSSSSGGKHTGSSSSSGGKHTGSSSSSGGKHSSSSSSSDGKHNSSSSSSGGKHSSSSSSSGGKHSDDSSKPDKEQGKGKDKLAGNGGSGVSAGGSAQDMYNKLHPPGADGEPSNGSHARGDVSQPGAGHSGGSGADSSVRGHIHTGGTSPVNVQTRTEERHTGKSPLNMVDPDRFGGSPMAPTNNAAEQFRHRGEAINDPR